MIAFRAIPPAVRLFGLCAVFTCLTALASANPVSIQFPATISQVQGDPTSLNLPFTLSVGQQITGEVSFASEADLIGVFTRYDLTGTVKLKIGGTDLQAPTNFGLLNSSGMIGLPAPNSSVYFGYLSNTNVYPGWAGHIGNNYWNFELVLFGPDGTVTSPNDLLNPALLNQLNTRRILNLSFGVPNTTTVQLNVGDITFVPEPTSLVLFALFGGVAMVRRQRR